MDATERASLLGEVDGVLATRIRFITPTPRLNERYQRDSWARRSRIVRAFLLWAIAFNIVMCGLDYIIHPPIVGISLFMRLGCLTTIWLVVFGIWMRPRARWIEGISLPIIVGTMVLAGGVIGVIGGTTAHLRYLESALLGAAPAIIILPMARVWTITACLTALGLYGLASFAHPLAETKDAVAFGIFSALVFSSLVPARHAINRLLLHGYLLTLRDALKEIALEEVNERLSVLATTDELTGLANRRAFETLAGTLSRQMAPPSTLGVMLLDIDHFKKLNDAMGHDQGDACLKAIATTIHQAIPEAHIVARYGGEEFIALFSEVSPRTLEDLAERVRRTVEERAFANPGLGLGRSMTVSIGLSLAVVEEGGHAIPELVRSADGALYRAKREGRNRHAAVWTPPSGSLGKPRSLRSA